MLQNVVYAHIIQAFAEVRFELTLIPAHSLGLTKTKNSHVRSSSVGVKPVLMLKSILRCLNKKYVSRNTIKNWLLQRRITQS